VSENKPATYRFSLRDHTGWILGLGGAQSIAFGIAILTAGVLLNAGAPGLFVLAPLVAGAGFAFGQWRGQPIHQVAPISAAWGVGRIGGQHRWAAPLLRRRSDGRPARSQPALPPVLAGTTIGECGIAWTRRGRTGGAAVIRDRVEHTSTAVLRVSGREFALCEQSEQQRLLAMWGDALATFCTERGPVTKLRWTEWAAPAGLEDQFAYLDQHRTAPDDDPAVVTYRDLLHASGPMSTRHEVLIAVTVSERSVRRRGDTEPTINETLFEEVRLLSARLENAGLTVDLPLTPAEVAHVFRARLDPYGVPGSGGRKRTLTELAGLVSVANAGPMAMHTHWDHVVVDRSVHASYVIAEWPRLEVPPNWMEPLLLHAGGIRTVAVHYEPVPHSRSQRQIDRDTVKLTADEEQRQRQGFRIGARHRRAQSEVAEREAELVAGFPEFEYVGTVTITAADHAALQRSCAEYEQIAAQVGLELRRLDGQHDLALACALPIGRGIDGRRGLR
jgi:hypothetical protein